jgi:pyruvate,water dikinase
MALRDIDRTMRPDVGGKAAHLGELCRLAGTGVPEGFCIGADAWGRIVETHPALRALIDRLPQVQGADRERVGDLCREIRRSIAGIAVPEDLRHDIVRMLAGLGDDSAVAIRSSATTEDLPTASFAGQYETYLNIVGPEAVLEHICKCWASLFTERAVTYRIQKGFDHRSVRLAVIVQKMVFPDAAGILFTADPVTANRKVVAIDANFGLGDAVVAGLVTADRYKVRDGQVIDRMVASKKLATYAVPGGGTAERAIEPERQQAPVLADAQMVQLERIGRTIEAHFGCPQDIEWCLRDNAFHIVQARPITTLFPVPDVSDHDNHVYVSVGHQQMMTDAMKPLGWSIFQLSAGRPMYQAGGRLFVDIAPDLASPARRGVIVGVLGKSDPLIRGALTTILDRGDVIPAVAEDESAPGPGDRANGPALPDYQTLKDYDPGIVAELIQRGQQAVDVLRNRIQAISGPDLFDFIVADMNDRRQNRDNSQSFGVIMTAMNASSWVNETIAAWLGEKNAADTLTQSVPHNITSEMGLALLDVADAIRPFPEVIEYLQRASHGDLLADLLPLAGGQVACQALTAFLEKYGMRCAGEIDITRPRWHENPQALIPTILGHIKAFAPGAGKRKFEQGLQEAARHEQALLTRLAKLPDGAQKVAETTRMIRLIRDLSGYREYPKYGIVSRYAIYKRALLQEAGQLVKAGVVRDVEDIHYLTFDELREVVRTHHLDDTIISRRKGEYAVNQTLTPPRVFTSDGEIVTGAYQRDHLPPGALAGIPVSAGVIEGRARVVLTLEDAHFEEGDILVTVFTDPGWTAVFVAIRGLVTEVGGLMTHGAVIAREYGLPAVVGVEGATQRIRDGQRIRVHGTEGYVEIL